VKRFVRIALLVVSFLALFAAAPVFASAAAPASGPMRFGDPAASAPADWTVALYVDADNDLYRVWRRLDVTELKRLPLSPRVNVVALVDTPGRNGVQLVRYGGGREEVLGRYPERNFGDPAVLTSFLRKVHSLFPSERLLADVWDHGDAWKGLCWDDTSNDHLTLAELRKALSAAAVPIDVLSCDTCLSADAALAYDVSTTGMVKYLVASEELVPADGFCYDAMLAPVIADPALPAEKVLTAQVDGYERYYLALPYDAPTTLSAIDLGQVRAMLPDLLRWSQALTAALPSEAARLATDVRRSPTAAWSTQVDLGAVAARMAADPWIESDEVTAASAALAADVHAAVLGLAGSPDTAGHTGLTIWFGTGSEWRRYGRAFSRQTLFAADAGWRSFLRTVAQLERRHPWIGDPDFDETLCLNDVRFADRLHGEAVGYVGFLGMSAGVAVHTEDGGATWSSNALVSGSATLTGVAPLGGRYASVGSAPLTPALFVRAGGGRAAKRTRLPSSAYFFDIATDGSRTAWASGERVLLATSDGGKRWKKLTAAPSARLTSVALADATHGWVAGEDVMGDVATIWASTDGGATFVAQAALPGATVLGLQALDSQNVWSCGGDRLGGHGFILHTADGGATWTAQLGGADVPCLSALYMRDGSSGWAVGKAGAVYQTVDGGGTWQPVGGVPSTADLNAIAFGDALHGCIVGDRTVLLTADGGTTWIEHDSDVPTKKSPRLTVTTHDVR
jgi:photosystem II stability/assembly factor-like uncharacterized protein